MSTATAAPQHMTALERANHVRLGRAELKRRIFAGDVDLAEIMDPDAEIPDVLHSAPILEALMAQRRWGRTRARRLLVSVGIGERRRLDALTARERVRVAAAIRRTEHREIAAAA